MTMPNVAPKVSLVDLLAQIAITPDQVKYVGISHYHADHTGQVSSFPEDDAANWEGRLGCHRQSEGVNFKPFDSWIKGELFASLTR